MREDKRNNRTDETLREQLSALLDDELELDASRFLLSRLQHDQSLSRTLDRYQLIQQCLRQESLERLGDQRLRTRVRAALESTPQETPRKLARHGSPWLRPLGGVAVAASVALMAIFGVDGLRQTGSPAMDMSSTLARQAAAPATRQADHALPAVSMPLDVQSNLQTVAHTQVLPARLNRYLRGPGVRQVVDGQQPVRYIYLVRPTATQQGLPARERPQP